MYDTQDSVPVRDWITIGVIFLILVVAISLGVVFAQNSSSSTNSQSVPGQLVTLPGKGTVQPKTGQVQTIQPQDGQQPENNKTPVASPKDQKNINQANFLQTFLLILLGAVVFTVVISVLIALLVIQLTSIIRRLPNKNNQNPPDK